jgi:hypothetical protein
VKRKRRRAMEPLEGFWKSCRLMQREESQRILNASGGGSPEFQGLPVLASAIEDVLAGMEGILWEISSGLLHRHLGKMA